MTTSSSTNISKPTTDIPLTYHLVDGSGLDILHGAQTLPQSVLLFGSGPCRDVKAYYPQIKTIYRRYIPNQRDYWGQGAAGARGWLDAYGDLTGVDYMVGPNEEVSYVADETERSTMSRSIRPKGSIDDIGEAVLYDQFHSALQRLLIERYAGRVKLIGFQWPVGGPSKEVLLACAPSAQEIVRAGGLIGIHPYWPRLSSEGGDFYAYRIAMLVGWFAEAGIAIRHRHFAITECGTDVIHSWIGTSGPWRTLVNHQQLTIASYQYDLEHWAQDMRAWGISIAAIYTWRGGAGQEAYEHDDMPPMREWLKAVWQRYANVPPPIPAMPDYIWAKPGGTYSAVFLRATPSEGARVGNARRGTRLRVLTESGSYYQVELLVDGVELNAPLPAAWIPKSLTSLTAP